MVEEAGPLEYIRVVRRWWWLVVGLGFVAAAVTGWLSSRRPSEFESVVLLTVTKPRYVLEFDPRVEANDAANPRPDARVYATLATSDSVLEEVLAQLEPRPEGLARASDLRTHIVARVAENAPNMIELVARWDEARTATRLANAWATALTARANELFAPGSSDQVHFFEEQLQEAEARLQAAEEAVIDFQRKDQTSIVQAKLASAEQDVRVSLAERREVEGAIRRVQALQERAASLPSDAPAELADQLSLLLLQAQVLGNSSFSLGTQAEEDVSTLQVMPGGQLLLQFQPSAMAEGGQRSIAEHRAALDAFLTTLEGQLRTIDARLSSLEEPILSLQQQLEEIKAESNQIYVDRDVAKETQQSLLRKLTEVQIAAEDLSGQVVVASPATGARRLGSRGLHDVATAGASGLVVGAVGAVWLDMAFHRPARGPKSAARNAPPVGGEA